MRRTAALTALLLALPARADILIDGNQHNGRNDTTADATSQLIPVDPVTRAKVLAAPTNFHLSQAATVTGIKLSNAILEKGDVAVAIDGVNIGLNFCAACAACAGRQVCAASLTVTPTVPQLLSAGFHTIAVSPNNNGNDNVGFSAITLVSAQTTTSRMLSQRRHIGDDNDANDDYDTAGTPRLYPDVTEGNSIDMTFNTDADRRLIAVDFRRLRDVDTNNGQFLVDGVFLGNILNTGGAVEVDPQTTALSQVLVAGTHTLHVDSGTIAVGNRDSISWDGVILRFASLGAGGTPGRFNAVDSGANGLSGSITTKIAGGSATLDLYGLDATGTALDATFNGAANVDILDATDNSGAVGAYGCRSTWTVLQSLGPVAFVAGRASVTPTFPVAGVREARVRITDPVSTVSGCSIDNFAIRPAGFGSIFVMHSSETAAGTVESLNNTGSSGLPRHKAGQPFTILATAVGAGGVAATNYDGTPSLKGYALAPATADGLGIVSTWIALGGGQLETDTAKYYEAGPATLELKDDTYASVDADDSTLAQMTIGPTYVNVGRFIPDHFTLAPETSPQTFTAACNSFSYAGQPFALTTPPYRASITAVAANGAVTTNYGVVGLYGLPAGNLATDTTFPALTGVVAPTSALSPDHTLTNLGNGVTRYELLSTQFQFTRGAPGAPFDAEIAIQPGALNETDGVDFSPSPGQIGAPTAGNGIDFTGTGADPKEIRFGRLVVDNAHGSERLPLIVPLRAEYWATVSGNTGFVTNLADTCTPPTPLTPAQFDTTTGATVTTAVTAVSAIGATKPGQIDVTLGAPMATGTAPVKALIATALPWLLTDDADADTLYNNPPAGLASFGLFNNGDTRIYQREVVGP